MTKPPEEGTRVTVTSGQFIGCPGVVLDVLRGGFLSVRVTWGRDHYVRTFTVDEVVVPVGHRTVTTAEDSRGRTYCLDCHQHGRDLDLKPCKPKESA